MDTSSQRPATAFHGSGRSVDRVDGRLVLVHSERVMKGEAARLLLHRGVCSPAAKVQPKVRPGASVAEGHGAVAGKLHQRRSALELGVLHEVSLVEGAVVEADRTT